MPIVGIIYHHICSAQFHLTRQTPHLVKTLVKIFTPGGTPGQNPGEMSPDAGMLRNIVNARVFRGFDAARKLPAPCVVDTETPRPPAPLADPYPPSSWSPEKQNPRNPFYYEKLRKSRFGVFLLPKRAIWKRMAF